MGTRPAFCLRMLTPLYESFQAAGMKVKDLLSAQVAWVAEV